MMTTEHCLEKKKGLEHDISGSLLILMPLKIKPLQQSIFQNGKKCRFVGLQHQINQLCIFTMVDTIAK